jgi:tRNA (guanine-N7-)-methyltransferase
MRKKKNLESRLNAHPDYLLLTEQGYYVEPQSRHGKFSLREVFASDNPTWLEIGCGKGSFAITLAMQNPSVNVLALEVVSNVIVEGLELADKEKPQNLKFINCLAEHIDEYFDERSFERIYLNFSCPYPKNSYANRRLTAPRFLRLYRKMLTKDGVIYQKTDSRKLFEFSIENFSEQGYILRNVSLDLHNSEYKEDNVITEYESKFISMGLPIYRLEAVNPDSKEQ